MLQPIRNKASQQQELSNPSSFAAPVKGWNTRDPLANMGPLYAITLDNWLPETGTVSVREGATAWQTGYTVGVPIKTLMPWNGVSSQKLYAVTDSGIYDASSGGTVGAVVQARTNGSVQYVNFRTTGKSYLVTVNGVDDLAYYDGTSWTTLANFSISGGGTITTPNISNINTYKRSLYFIGKNSLSFYYLPIDSITGTVSEFPLGALFTKGGYLVSMGTWTLDGGFGSEDYSAFITSEGQVAVYQGTDPSTSATWALKGVYDMAPPQGKNCWLKFGGDLLLLCTRGVFSMTTMISEKQFSQRSALSDIIGEAFTEAATLGGTLLGWQMIEYPAKNVLVCNIPRTAFSASFQFVMNTKTGAWCRFKGWNANSFCFYNNELYAAMSNKVAKVFRPGNDFDASITAEAKAAFNYHSPRSRLKDWKMVRPNLTIGGKVAVNAALDTDFRSDAEFGAAVFNTATQSRWDDGLWDSAQWSFEPQVRVDWLTVTAEPSYCSALRLRVIARDATIAWSAYDVLYETGAILG